MVRFNVDSKILWIKADREMINMLRTIKRETKTPIDIEFMQFLPQNHMKILNKIKAQCAALKVKSLSNVTIIISYQFHQKGRKEACQGISAS